MMHQMNLNELYFYMVGYFLSMPCDRAIVTKNRIFHRYDRPLDLIHSRLETHSRDRESIVLPYELDSLVKTVISRSSPFTKGKSKQSVN